MKSFLFITLLLTSVFVQAQDMLITKNAKVRFFSTTPIEDIEAINQEATSLINKSSGEMAFTVLIKSFRFQKALMQEHFNENYMESDKFPKSTFKGNITNLKDINFEKDGTYKTDVKGDLTMHGVTQAVTTSGTITVKDGKVSSNAVFKVKLDDYKIERPAVVANKIADFIEVTVDAAYEPFKK
jgi:polyisoprenoid-binding protein YceI